MSKNNEMTIQECLQGAFAALLRGDLAERDRLIELARLGFKPGEQEAPGDRSIMEVAGTKQ